MILVGNDFGTTNLALNELRLEENSHRGPSTDEYDSMFTIFSDEVFMTLEYGFIYKTSAAFLSVGGHSAHINISNIEVDGFESIVPGGGIFDVSETGAGYLSIHDSSFRMVKTLASAVSLQLMRHFYC